MAVIVIRIVVSFSTPSVESTLFLHVGGVFLGVKLRLFPDVVLASVILIKMGNMVLHFFWRDFFVCSMLKQC